MLSLVGGISPYWDLPVLPSWFEDLFRDGLMINAKGVEGDYITIAIGVTQSIKRVLRIIVLRSPSYLTRFK